MALAYSGRSKALCRGPLVVLRKSVPTITNNRSALQLLLFHQLRERVVGGVPSAPALPMAVDLLGRRVLFGLDERQYQFVAAHSERSTVTRARSSVCPALDNSLPRHPAPAPSQC